jgi:DNA (cytosine-5)-methyltransferase 1
VNVIANTYFTGAGLFDLGLKRGGITIGQSFEIDSICCQTLRRNFDHEIVECDITQKTVAADKGCDVIIGAYPCVKYSSIADIHGTRTGDDLYLHFFRHIALSKPELYSLENVPGMKKFPVVMEAMTTLPDYYVNVFCPVSSSNWLPQRRDRLIIIGSRRSFNWREPQSQRRPKLAELLESEPVVKIPRYVEKRIKGGYRDRPIISDPKRDDIAPTCVAHYSKDLSTRLVVDRRFPFGLRPYTVREYARLQGVPDNFKFSGSDRDAYRMIGNGVSVPVGEWLGREIVRYFN